MLRVARNLRIVAVGRKADGAGEGIRLVEADIDGFAQELTLEHRGRKHAVRLPLVGEFQIENALVAAGLAIGTGSEPEAVFASARTSRRREGPAGAGRRAQRRADLCRLRAQARRAGEGAAGAAALRQTQARRGVRRRRRPRCRASVR